MIWDIIPKYKHGKKRYKIKFALIPRFTKDRYLVWMERYIEELYYSALYKDFAFWAFSARWSRDSDVWKKIYIDELREKNESNK